jgi:hypothetical protein
VDLTVANAVLLATRIEELSVSIVDLTVEELSVSIVDLTVANIRFSGSASRRQ